MGSARSTSFHRLNADKGLGPAHRGLWFLLNWLNNNFLPNTCDGDLAMRDFAADVSDDNWRRTDVKSSPSRKLGDLFWLSLPWERIETELGRVCVLDAGCGSGNYAPRLQSFSGNRIDSYTGVDVVEHKNWSVLTEKHPNFKFCRSDSADILDHIPEGTNLFMSQSAIEHFEEDLRFFDNIRAFIQRTPANVLQVHLFPSAACLRLYPGHGVRQYVPRTVSRITALFKPFSYSVLFRLGGRRCNALHREFITRPRTVAKAGDLRDTMTNEYDARLRQAISADNEEPHERPSFYVLLVHSNCREILFK